MKFIHTGDIHLGAHPENKKEWAAKRGDEIWESFERLIKKIKMQPVDLLIIAGDMFHRQPLLREVREVDYLLSTIPDTKIVLSSGISTLVMFLSSIKITFSLHLKPS